MIRTAFSTINLTAVGMMDGKTQGLDCRLLMAVEAKGLKVLHCWENGKEAGESGTTCDKMTNYS